MDAALSSIENIHPKTRMQELRTKTKVRMSVYALYVFSVPYLIEYIIVLAFIFESAFTPILGFSLFFQLLAMNTVVFRSSKSKKISNAIRCSLFGCVIGLGHVFVATQISIPFLPTLMHCFLALLTVQVSDYCFHRFLWHAHWTKKLNKIERILWNPLRVHTIHHFNGHHRHYQNKEQKERMLRQEHVHHSAKDKVEHQYKDDVTAMYALRCSDHGVTMYGFECVGSFTIGYFCLPTGTSIIIQFLLLSSGELLLPLGVMIQMAVVSIPVFLNMNHAFYHSTPEARYRASQGTMLKKFWNSREMNRLAKDHDLHHRKGERYGVVPYYRYIVSVVFGEY